MSFSFFIFLYFLFNMVLTRLTRFLMNCEELYAKKNNVVAA